MSSSSASCSNSGTRRTGRGRNTRTVGRGSRSRGQAHRRSSAGGRRSRDYTVSMSPSSHNEASSSSAGGQRSRDDTVSTGESAGTMKLVAVVLEAGALAMIPSPLGKVQARAHLQLDRLILG